jgi:hypothetical protein
VLAGGKQQETYQLLLNLAQIDPAEALERLETAKLANPDDVGFIRITAAQALSREDLDEALAVVEALPTADDRAQGYLAICEALPSRDPGRAKPLLDQAIVNARAAKRMRLFLIEKLAGRLIELGEIERARGLIREGEGLAKTAFEGEDRAHALARLAGLLLRIDPASALAAFEHLKRQAMGDKVTVRAFGYDRHYGQAAYHLAARNPAEAERLVRRISFTLVRPANEYILAVCARMAPADLPRARRLTELITVDELVLKPHALGLMAQAIATSDKPAATRLLGEAYAELERLAAQGWTSQFASICGVAGGLLPVAEQVDAARLPEFLARALALRPPTGGRNEGSWIPEQAASLAMMVARYDRGLAARIVRPELEGLGIRQGVSPGESAQRVLTALALIDPRRAVEQVEALADDPGPGTDPNATKNMACIQVAKLLALHGAERWRHVYEYFLYLWTPDQRYL